MKPLFIDTNAYSALRRGDLAIAEIIQYAEILAISPIVIGELLYGFDNGNNAGKNREDLQRFLDSPRVACFSISNETARYFSQITLSLKRKGKPIPSNDIWIAAQALENGCMLCSYDQHFLAIEGLITVSSISDFISM